MSFEIESTLLGSGFTAILRDELLNTEFFLTVKPEFWDKKQQPPCRQMSDRRKRICRAERVLFTSNPSDSLRSSGGMGPKILIQNSGVKVAKDMATVWQLQYKHRRPHGALGQMCPAKYAACCPAAADLENQGIKRNIFWL